MRKEQGTGILGIIVVGIMFIFNFIVENWQIICIVLVCIALIIFAVKFFKIKKEDNKVFELKREFIEKIEKDNQINKIQTTKNKVRATVKKQKNKKSPKPKEKKSDKLNLLECSKNDILTINGFTEEKARQFIKERKKDYMWYDAESFAQYFDITQPHQILDIQSRIIFPQKPHAKQGRKVDF